MNTAARESRSGPGPGAREKLLQTAIVLFASKGYAATSVREIVTLAGVSRPVLYYYFQSKEGLFHAILEHAMATQKKVLAEALEHPGPALERLVQLYHLIYEGVQKHHALFIMIHNLFFGPPRGAPACDLLHFHRGLVAAIQAILDDGRAAGEIRAVSTEDAAYLALSLIDFSLNMDQVRQAHPDPQRPERLLRLAFHGLRAGTPRGDADGP
jgi:AcrR family transcriptional regulator